MNARRLLIEPLVFLFQDEILAEELRKSEYSESASGSVFSSPEPLSVREPESFSFPVEKKSVSESTNDSGNLSDEASGPSAAQLLLDPPLTDEEISADLSAIINEASGLDELDMMIQSAGPFQHPRSVAQNYAHSNGNVYHRQPSYHHHPHHHQVSERPNILRLSISMTISSNKLNFSIKFCLDWFVVRGSHDSFVGLMTTSGHSQVVFLTKSTWRDSSQQYPLPTLRRVPTFSIYLILGCDIDRLLSCFLVIAEYEKIGDTKPLIRSKFASQYHFCWCIEWSLSSITNMYLYSILFVWNMIGSFCLLVFCCATILPAFKRTYPILPAHFFPFALFRLSFFCPFILWRTHTHTLTRREKKRKHLSISSWYRPIISRRAGERRI